MSNAFAAAFGVSARALAQAERVEVGLPAWVVDLGRQIAADHGVREPSWRWRSAPAGRTWTNGTCWGPWKRDGEIVREPYITVTAGSELAEKRWVVVHEMAHWILMQQGRWGWQHHGWEFYELAYDLYERYGVDRLTFIRGEERYKSIAAEVLRERYRRRAS